MTRYRLILFLAALCLIPALSSPAQAVEFTTADLQGTWHLHAFGVYEAEGSFYRGLITLSAEGNVVASSDSSFGWSPATFDGGGLVIFPNGSVGGKLSGLSFDWGGFWLAVQHGWMNLTKDQITFIGVDYESFQMIATLVRVK